MAKAYETLLVTRPYPQLFLVRLVGLEPTRFLDLNEAAVPKFALSTDAWYPPSASNRENTSF